MSELTTPAQLKAKLEKLWCSYKVHKDWHQEQILFPYRLKIKRPTDKTLLHQFEQVRRWSAQLSQNFDQHLLTELVNYASLGRQNMPSALEFTNPEQLARFLGKLGQWQDYLKNCRQLNQQLPELKDWLAQNPAAIIEYQSQWPQLLAVIHYFMRHPRPGCYIRQLDIPGIDSKFIEKHKKILKQLLDQVLPPHAIDNQFDKISEHGFEQRFGLAYPKPSVRFRLLDPQLQDEFGGLSDIELPIDQFANLDTSATKVIVTENKINGLALPELEDTLVIFGLGYGIQLLKNIHWLQQCQIHYWGDIDTHGLAILSQFRQYFPQVKSLLMDQQTLKQQQKLWGQEPANKVHKAEQLPGLTPTEQQLYQQLKTHHFGQNLRLEQERIGFGIVLEALEQEGFELDP